MAKITIHISEEEQDEWSWHLIETGAPKGGRGKLSDVFKDISKAIEVQRDRRRKSLEVVYKQQMFNLNYIEGRN